MIRFLSPEDAPVRRGLLLREGIFGVKALSQYDTYGPSSGTADFWLLSQEDRAEPTGVLFRQGGTFALCGQGDPEELSDFLKVMAPEEVEGPPALLDKLRLWGRREDGWLFEVALPGRELPSGMEIRPAGPLDPVYHLLSQGDPGFQEWTPYEGWLVENSHKIRHGLAQIWTLYQGETPVSTNGVYYQAPRLGLVASGATHPDWRGQGLFPILLEWTARKALQAGRSPWLIAAQPSLREFYLNLGLPLRGRWGRLLLS